MFRLAGVSMSATPYFFRFFGDVQRLKGLTLTSLSTSFDQNSAAAFSATACRAGAEAGGEGTGVAVLGEDGKTFGAWSNLQGPFFIFFPLHVKEPLRTWA